MGQQYLAFLFLHQLHAPPAIVVDGGATIVRECSITLTPSIKDILI